RTLRNGCGLALLHIETSKSERRLVSPTLRALERTTTREGSRAQPSKPLYLRSRMVDRRVAMINVVRTKAHERRPHFRVSTTTLVALLVFVIDQSTKALVRGTLAPCSAGPCQTV